MGNLVSQCVAAGGSGGARRRPVLIGPDGRPVWLQEEVAGAAELMIEAPGHVVARAVDVVREKRVRAMAADEPLRAGEVYLLVPAGRAGARLGDREVEAIGRLVAVKKAGKAASRRGGRRKIFPEAEARAEEDDVGEGKGIWCVGGQAQALVQDHGLRPRQWRPALDTIYEA